MDAQPAPRGRNLLGREVCVDLKMKLPPVGESGIAEINDGSICSMSILDTQGYHAAYASFSKSDCYGWMLMTI
jgi:hypothetical protein